MLIEAFLLLNLSVPALLFLCKNYVRIAKNFLIEKKTAFSKMSIYGVVKIVLAGDYATGKTTLKRSFMGMHLNEQYMSTLGVDLATYKHVDEDMVLIFQIFDLGGQSQFKSIRLQYYKGAEGSFIVFDKSRLETFNNLLTWIEEISNNTNNPVPTIIIGNKDDLLSPEENKMLDEKVLEFVQEHKKSHPNVEIIDYFSTCALQGRNVKKAFLTLGREIIERKSDEMLI